MNATADNSQLTYFRTATVFVWAALPAEAILYATSWNQLPERVATHFNLANQPNGWMSREGSLAFSLFVATFVAWIAAWVLSRVKKPDAAAWGLLALFYVIQGTLLWAENSTIAYNVEGSPVNATPVLATGIGATVLLVILALASRRGVELPAATVLADETHSSPAFAALMVFPALAFAVVIAGAPAWGLKAVLAFALVLMLAGGAMAGSGFHYLFTPAGVEIRTLGFRLRSIPANAIKSYGVDRWNVLGGYGIRGIGERRAYVWGNRGVTIKTSEGEIFLGHDDPEKIVRDLNLVTNHEGHEVSRSL